MGIPQIFVIALLAAELGLVTTRHGQPKPSATYNAASTWAAAGILLALLYWGGFFNPACR